jgi:hypothetical protein
MKNIKTRTLLTDEHLDRCMQITTYIKPDIESHPTGPEKG